MFQLIMNILDVLILAYKYLRNLLKHGKPKKMKRI